MTVLALATRSLPLRRVSGFQNVNDKQVVFAVTDKPNVFAKKTRDLAGKTTFNLLSRRASTQAIR